MVTRKMGATVSPVVEVTETDGEYTMKTQSRFKNSEIKFKLGEEFDEETPDGRKVKSVITLDGNKMTHVQKGEKDTVIEREFGPTEMKAVSFFFSNFFFHFFFFQFMRDFFFCFAGHESRRHRLHQGLQARELIRICIRCITVRFFFFDTHIVYYNYYVF